ncbi:type I polyketide synthase [Megalodesulfovibrio gigas]|uniref:type I polyketide synthase n=1 Tax=Megalodesulfovibrio gigas TaxID=879 RepID=UPI000414088F|nr:type I polyketide synthase [Megalodesulfovibrio gigas]
MKIAIIGAACRLPGGVVSLDTLWDVLASGRDAVSEIPSDRFDVSGFLHPTRTSPGRSCTFAAGVLEGIEHFDYSFFGISKKEAEYMDPQQRVLLELAWETLEDAQLRPSSLAGADTAVFVGSSSLDASMQRSDDPCVIGPYSMIGNTLSILANRISYLLDIHGPSMTIDTACSSSLVALHQACQCLASGEASMALAGGVHMLCCPLPFVGFSKAHMLSKDGRCRVFSKDANGYVRAEGGGLLLLKPLDKALEDGDRIHAVIAKTGVNTDGKTIGIAFPNRTAQMALLRTLYDDPAIDPRNISYMEAHGTGTSVGDPAEAQSIGEVFARLRPAQDPPLLVGSVKSNLGHLEPASGMAGLFKTLLVLKHRIVPPNLHLENPSPDIDFTALRLDPVTRLTPLPATPGPAVAGVNSFGFGGSNAHAVLEEAPKSAVRTPVEAAGTPPLLLSARSPRSLQQLAQAYAGLVREADAAGYCALAGRAALRRDHLTHRLALQAPSTSAVAEALDRLAMGEDPAAADVDAAMGETLGGVVRTAFVFSGNGGAWAGMGRGLILGDRDAARALDTLDDCLSPLLGWSVAQELLRDPASQRLDSIAVVQPLLFSIQVCLVESLRAKGVTPDMVFGHSIGEVAAAWCCGALSLADACRVIVERSRLQQESHGMGGMAVIQLSEEEARALPEVRCGDLEVAAVNSSKYVTLTGNNAALDALKISAKKRRLVFRRLNLEHPFHSRTMDAIKDRLLEKLAGIAPVASRIPFYSTVEGGCCPGETLDTDYWWRNIRQPVLFHKAALAALQGGGRVFVELGPDAMLQPFLKGCFQEHSATTVYLQSLKRDTQDGRVVASLWKRVHTAGAAVDLTAFFPQTPPYVALPSYPWDRELCQAESTPECLDVFAAKPPAHPLLGRRVRRGMPVWENTLDPQLVPFLREHVVGEDVVLPGAAYLEMALAAAMEAYGQRTVELENVEYRQPMTFGHGKARVVRLVLSPEQGDFTIESREQMQSSPVAVHVVGRMVPRLRKTFEPESVATDPAGHGQPCDVPALYAKARDAGLAFGPAFRPLRQVWRSGKDAFGRLELEPAADFAGAVLHPSLIDGSFQMLLALVDWRDKGLESYVYLPMRTGRFQLLAPGRAVYAQARLEQQSKRSLAASFSLYDEHGQELARMQDCRFIRFQTRDSMLRQQQIYAVTSVAVRHPLDDSPAPWPAVQDLDFAAALEPLRQSPRWQTRRQDVLPFFTALLLSQAHEMFMALKPDPHGFSVDHLLKQGGIQAGQAPYLIACLQLMEQMDLAARDGALWTIKESDLPPSLELWRQALREYPAYAGELALIAQMGEALPDMLRGKVQARSLLALRPGSALEQLHRTSPLHLDGHAAAGAVFSALQAALPHPGGLRLLEVCAGAGGLTQAILSRLAPGAAEYVLTDRDEHFAEQLKARWSDRPDVAVCTFDPEDPDSVLPETSASGGFDLVLLGHGLIRTKDLSQVLDRLYGLLRPGGLLLALDLLPHPVLDLLLGLDPDWWREESQENGAPLSRQLPGVEWSHALAEAGFREIRSLLQEADDEELFLTLARKPLATQAAAPALPATRWVLLEDAAPTPAAAALAEALCAALQVRGGLPPVRLGVNGVEPESADHWARQFTELAATSQGASLECIHLLGFDTRQVLDSKMLDAIQNRRAVSTVALAQGWQKAKSTAGLCLVTGGGLPLYGEAARSARPVPSQGALPGLARVLMNEMPGLQVRLVDAHADAQGALPQTVLDAAVREILHPAGPEEREVILCDAGRYSQRLAPLELAARVHPPVESPAAFSLEMTAQGKLDGAAWTACPPPAPEPGQVLVKNRAAGVNYRDIMFTLGRIPEEALEGGASGPTLGLECAGTVLAVGQGVDGVAPGDTVCCLGGKLYDSHVLARAGDVFPLPAGMSCTDAATIPVAHFTA